jgi:protein involved in polysaccharide export with SLBB domain
LSIGDLNKDGNPDIFAGSFRADVQIFLGNGQGQFKKSISPSIFVKRQAQKHAGDEIESEDIYIPIGDESYWKVLAVDLDGDGNNDIVASSLDSRGILAWRNRGKKGWKAYKGSFPTNGEYYGLVAADLNNDNWPDICAAGFGEGIKIWPGKKEGFKVAKNRQIEVSRDGKSKAEFLVPKENAVFVTVAGNPEYKIDPGDVLEITLWQGITPQKHEIQVRPDGKISFGFVEDLTVSGLTTAQLDDRLTKFLAEYVKKPRIDILVKEHKSKSVMLVGAINSSGMGGTGPGKYFLSGKTTVLEMITKASGPAADANLTRVRVRRQNGQSISLNLYKVLLQGDVSQDLIIDDGDIVFVPTLSKEGNRVYVFGEVEQPGAYTFSGPDMNLLDAISEAGGPTIFASTANTKIARGDPVRPEIITADLGSLMTEGNFSQNIALVNGDMIYVPRSGWGNINLVNKRIRPLMEMILWPARTVIDWYRAGDIISSGGTN